MQNPKPESIMNSHLSVYSGGVSAQDLRYTLLADEQYPVAPQFIRPDSAFPPDLNITLPTFPMDNTSCAYLFDPLATFMPVLADHCSLITSPSPLSLGNAAPSFELDHCSFGPSAVSTSFTSGLEPAALAPSHTHPSRRLDVPRPRSAFKIYSSLFNALAPYQRTTNHRLEKKIKERALNLRDTGRPAAACWRALSPMDREMFKDLARTEKELARIKHRRNNRWTPNFHRPTKVPKLRR